MANEPTPPSVSRRGFFKRSLPAATSVGLAPALSSYAATPPPGSPPSGPLQICRSNPRYFADQTGMPLFLTGSHTWPSLVDMGPSPSPPPFNFNGYLDFLERFRHNFIRLWTWESTTWDTTGNRQTLRHHVRPLAWARTGPGIALDGLPKFDLTQFDAAYFTRLRSRLEAARNRGIFVSVMLFEGWAMQHAPGAWESHPFHPSNNTQALNTDPNQDQRGLEIHTLKIPAVTRLQEAYVRKVIETVNDLDNVLYEISNENHPASTAWQYHFIDLIHRTERNLPKQHPVGMTFQYKGGSNQMLFDSPADWISPNHEGGYRDNPPANDGRKVILTDTDHLWGIGGNVPWVWKSMLRGHNPIFMDPYDNAVLGKGPAASWDSLRNNLGWSRQLLNRVPLTCMIPRADLASTSFCLAGQMEYHAALLGWSPADSPTLDLDLTEYEGLFAATWLNTQSGQTSPVAKVQGGATLQLESPFPADSVLLLESAPR